MASESWHFSIYWVFVMRMIFLFLLTCFCLPACGDGVDPDYKINYNLINENFECPSPSRIYTGQYRKSGVFFICKFNDGPFIAVEGGYVHVRGQYKAGREVGLWEHYDKDGNSYNSSYYFEFD